MRSSSCGTEREGADEQQLAQLHADVEKDRRERDRILRQADFAQHAGEAEAMQQAEGECHHHMDCH
jgi:hypothetical protein